MEDDKQIQIMLVAFCLIIFGAHMIILCIIKVKKLMLTKWLDRSPQLCWLLSLEWLAYSVHEVQSILNTCLFGGSS